MEAAFDDSDDEDDRQTPLTSRNGYQSLPNAEPVSHDHDHDDLAHRPGEAAHAPSHAAYDFENTDFDYIRPPPGSPPDPSARALPNEFGNSNGLVPSFSEVRTDAGSGSGSRRGNWLRRTAASVLPTHYVERLGLGSSDRPQGPVGGDRRRLGGRGRTPPGLLALPLVEECRHLVRLKEAGQAEVVLLLVRADGRVETELPGVVEHVVEVGVGLQGLELGLELVARPLTALGRADEGLLLRPHGGVVVGGSGAVEGVVALDALILADAG